MGKYTKRGTHGERLAFCIQKNEGYGTQFHVCFMVTFFLSYGFLSSSSFSLFFSIEGGDLVHALRTTVMWLMVLMRDSWLLFLLSLLSIYL